MHRTTIRPSQFLLVAMSFAFSVGAQATTTLHALGGGWFSNVGAHGEYNTNYAVGGGGDGYTRNNYFLFDTSGVGGPVTSAMLRVYNPDAPASPGVPFGYTSADPSETYALFDVSPAFINIVLPGGRVAGYEIGSPSGQDIFNDLGSGQSYGMYNASLADNGQFVEISLNSASLAAMNANSGLFGIGGAITTLDAVVNRESLFVSAYLGFPTSYDVQLVISSVPEPSESLLLIMGLALVGMRVRRSLDAERAYCPRNNCGGQISS